MFAPIKGTVRIVGGLQEWNQRGRTETICDGASPHVVEYWLAPLEVFQPALATSNQIIDENTCFAKLCVRLCK